MFRIYEAINAFEIIPDKTALLIVDMQYGLLHSDSGLVKLLKQTGGAEYFLHRVNQIAVPNIKKLLDLFRENNLRIIYINLGSETTDFRDFSPRWQRQIKHWMEKGNDLLFPRVGTRDYEVVEELRPHKGELVINKVTLGAFNGSNIDRLMRNLGIETLVITGQGTNACVETTLRDAADRGYDCILVEDACAASSKATHDAALRGMEPTYCRVESTGQVIETIKSEIKRRARLRN